MQITTVTPQFVNQPKKPGGKYGSIKDGNGTYWSVPVGLLPHFKPNEPASVEWEMNGEYYNIKGIVGHAAPQPIAAPSPQPITPKANGHTPGSAGTPGIYFKERCMFIMAAMKALSADRGPGDVKLFALAADEAWNELEARWHG